jgi:hypothetical protein
MGGINVSVEQYLRNIVILTGRFIEGVLYLLPQTEWGDADDT